MLRELPVQLELVPAGPYLGPDTSRALQSGGISLGSEDGIEYKNCAHYGTPWDATLYGEGGWRGS